ncbi:MAG: hypothetical protein LBC59_02970 [Chitinispirillales bacterium]|jgi:hypothetical protein|nr:hypothetical protein [Chitinispirillales bacterium]
MKRVLLLASAALFLAAAAVGAQNYVLTNGSPASTFTATKNGVALAENVTQDSALNSIRRNAIGEAVTIQLGGGSPLDMGNGPLRFEQLTATEVSRFNFTKIKLTGNIKTTGPTALYFTGSSSYGITEVEINANLEGGISANSSASGYRFAITGGSINLTSGSSNFFRDNKVTISGGTFSKTSGWGSYGLVDSENGDLTITGGTFETKNNRYVISLDGSGKAMISGGEFKTDTAETSVIGILRTASVTINGGKITNSAAGGVAVNLLTAGGALTLGGSPEITGALSFKYAGRVSADTTFNPGALKYKLLLAGSILNPGAIVVRGGGAHVGSFQYVHPPYTLAAAGGNIVITLPANFTAPKYVITSGADGSFLAKKSGTDKEWSNASMSIVIDSIRADAQALPCSLQFGNGTSYLDVASGRVIISGSSGDGWGKVTLLGKLSGTASSNQGGPIPILTVGDVTVDNFADIKVNDASPPYVIRFSANTDFTHKGGEIAGGIYLIGVSRSALTVSGGKVRFIHNSSGDMSENTITVSGGTVGDSSLTSAAIRNDHNSDGDDIIISGGMVVSADTSENGGTIRNVGKSCNVKITGGTILNIANTEKDAHAVYSKTDRGVVDITGGKISRVNNTASDPRGAAVYVEQNAVDSEFVKMLSISGTAEITSNAWYTVQIKGNGISSYGALVGGAEAEISGGKIENTLENKSGCAVYSAGGARVTISGTAELSAKSYNGKTPPQGGPRIQSGVVYGYRSMIYILGGKIKSIVTDTAAYNPIAVTTHSYQQAPGGTGIYVGGTPDIEGALYFAYGGATSVLTDGLQAFRPGTRVYKVATNSQMTEGMAMVSNGAGFTSNFALATVYSDNVANDRGFRLGANGDHIVATAGSVYDVSFNVMGASGTPPATIKVIAGGTLGELAKPATKGYVSAGGFTNDGKWYRSNGMLGGQHIQGPEFKFGIGNDGTRVNDDMTLILSWTDVISVLASNREIPAAQGPTVIAIAPVSVVAAAGELSAGPIPSALLSGNVSFFWNGAPIKAGKLSIFDAAGNAVTGVAIGDKSGAAGKRTVAVWNLTDAKGRPVAAGTYLAKGVITTKSGSSERVSIVLGVK